MVSTPFITIFAQMFIIFHISSSAETLTNRIIGPNGQDCTPEDDNAPDECRIGADGTFTSLITDEVECEENFDCCTCKSIVCGSNTGNLCEKFVANGDSSAFYVSDIVINGDDAEIDCNGDRSCEGTKLTGTGIDDVKCSGDRACANAEWILNCVDDGCKIECDGDSSCAGMNTNAKSSFTITNSAGLICDESACAHSEFNLIANQDDGDKIECDGTRSCFDAHITVQDNIETIVCGDDYACLYATFIVINPSDDFELQCKGTASCEGLKMEIVIPSDSDVTEFKGFDCGATEACRDAEITIVNQSSRRIKIEELECESDGACGGIQFNLSGWIEFEDCKCGDNGGCLGAIGIENCFD